MVFTLSQEATFCRIIFKLIASGKIAPLAPKMAPANSAFFNFKGKIIGKNCEANQNVNSLHLRFSTKMKNAGLLVDKWREPEKPMASDIPKYELARF